MEYRNLAAIMNGWGCSCVAEPGRLPAPEQTWWSPREEGLSGRADTLTCQLPHLLQAERLEERPRPSAHNVSYFVHILLAQVDQGLPPHH